MENILLSISNNSKFDVNDLITKFPTYTIKGFSNGDIEVRDLIESSDVVFISREEKGVLLNAYNEEGKEAIDIMHLNNADRLILSIFYRINAVPTLRKLLLLLYDQNDIFIDDNFDFIGSLPEFIELMDRGWPPEVEWLE